LTFSGDTNTGIFSPAADTIAFSEGGVESMRIDASGNLGLGVTPSAFGMRALQVAPIAAIGSAGAISSFSSNVFWTGAYSGQTYIANGFSTAYLQNAGSHVWYTAPSGTAGNAISFTQAMTLDASGDLVVGDTITNAIRISAVKSNPTRGVLAHVYNIAASGHTGAQIQFTQNAVANWTIGQPAGTHAFAFWSDRNTGSDGNERARITSDGNLLVGTTTSRGRFTSEAVGTSTGCINTNTTASSGTRYHAVWYESGTERGSVTSAGGGVVYNSVSDYRLKDNITPMTGALARVAALKPVTYTWKNSGAAGEGFIAHELQEVCPLAVTREKDAVDEEGKPKYQGIDTSFLVATLTAAIQELKAELDATKAEVALLKGAA
jgi:hypothetical protein